jgi:hypothetical protein
MVIPGPTWSNEAKPRITSFTIGEVTIIEAEGKRLFYSGDLRSHGRKGILFENFVKRAIRHIDLLFLMIRGPERIRQAIAANVYGSHRLCHAVNIQYLGDD